MRSTSFSNRIPILFAMVALWSGQAAAQPALTVTAVQWVQGRPNIPHPAVNGKTTMLQAIVEGGNCGGNYQYRWDWNGDGDFLDANEGVRNASSAGNYAGYFAPLELDVQYPPAQGDTLYFPKVEVTCAGATASTTMPVLIRVDRICTGANPPFQCTAEQNVNLTRRVHADRAVDRALWWMFKQFRHFSDDGYGHNVHTCRFESGSPMLYAHGHALNAFLRRGHGHGAGRDSDVYFRHLTQCGVHAQLTTFSMRGGLWFDDRNDVGRNGEAITYTNGQLGDFGYYSATYGGSAWVEPIASFGNPDYVAPAGAANVFGRSLREIGQDLADGLVQCMTSDGAWFYTCQNGAGTTNDASTNGWSPESLRLLRRKFGTETYQVARDRQRNWLGRYCPNGRCVYHTTDHPGPQARLSGNALVGYGWTENEVYSPNNATLQSHVLAIESNNHPHIGLYYMYASTKGLRSFNPEITLLPGGRNWANEFTDFLFPLQLGDGSWDWAGEWPWRNSINNPARTAMITQIIQSWLEVQAYARATPEGAGPGIDITFDHSFTYILDPAVTVREYRWNVKDYPAGLDLNRDGDFTDEGEKPREDRNNNGRVDQDEIVWDYTTDRADAPFVYRYDDNLGWDDVVNYTVTLGVLDSQNRLVYDTDNVRIQLSLKNHVPVIVPHPEGRDVRYRGYIGTDVILDGRESFDVDTEHAVFPGDANRARGTADRITSIHFDLNLDGDFNDAGEDGTLSTVTLRLREGMAAGDILSVPMRVCDDGQWNGKCYDGVTRPDCSECAFGSAPVELVRNVLPPAINVGQNPYNANLRDPVQLDLSGTRDPEGVLGIRYEYELLDNPPRGQLQRDPAFAQGNDWGPRPKYIPNPDGPRTDRIRVRAYDFLGLMSEGEIRVAVPNVAPAIAAWDVSYEGKTPTVGDVAIENLGNGRYRATVSAQPNRDWSAFVNWQASDVGNDPLTAAADMNGDGANDINGQGNAGRMGPFTWPSGQARVARLRVNDGNDTTEAAREFQVPAADPSLRFFFDLGADGTYEVAGGGQPFFEFQVGPNVGEVMIAGDVRGVGGAPAPFEQQLVLANEAPVIEVARILSKNGFDVVVSASAADPDGDDVVYTFNWGDGSPPTRNFGGLADHTFPNGQFRAYTITVAAEDGRGGRAERQLQVQFDAPPQNRAPTVDDLQLIRQGDWGVTAVAAAQDADGDRLNFSFNWGDGTPPTAGASSVAAHNFPANQYRAYDVTVTVTDGRGGQAQRQARVEFVAPPANRNPTVTDLQVVKQGGFVVSAVAVAADADGDALSYRFDWGDGSGPTVSASSVAPHTYAANVYRPYIVTVTVTDEHGGSAQRQAQVEFVAPPANRNPTVDDLQALRQGEWGVSAVAVASDPDGENLTFRFNWGDGSADTVGASSVAAHNYPANQFQAYTITVTVTDPRGGQAVRQTQVEFVAPPANRAPTIEDVQVFRQGDWGATIVVGASDPDGDRLVYSIDWADGSPATVGGSSLASHNYPQGRFQAYNIVVTVTDGRGGQASRQARVEFVAPPANQAPSIEALSLLRQGDWGVSAVAGASDPDGDRLTFSFDWGDGSPATVGASSLAAHNYPANQFRPYTVTLTVTDGRGGQAQRQAQVEFAAPPANRNPVVEALQILRQGNWGVSVVAGAADPDGDALAYTFDWGDGSPPTNAAGGVASHVYPDGQFRAYTITVTVRDGRGGEAQRQGQVNFPQPAANRDPSFETLRVVPQEGFEILAVAGAADPDGDALTYTFAWGDGAPDTVNRSGIAAHGYAANIFRAYTITATVEDGRGGRAQRQIEVDFPEPEENAPPVIGDVAQNGGSRGLVTVTVDAFDPEGSRLSYRIHWGDEADPEATAPLLGGAGSHRFALRAEPYAAYVVVTDAHGNETREAFEVRIQDGATIVRDFSANVVRDGTVLFTAVAEDPDGDDFLVYSFDFTDDGIYEVVNQADGSLIHNYAEAGDYQARVRVTDTWSTNSVTATVRLRLQPWVGENGAPVIGEVVVRPGPRGEVDLAVDAWDPEGGRVTYVVHWGDEEGEEATEALIGGVGEHVYDFPIDGQPYSGWVVVTDDAGSTTRAEFEVTIEDHATQIRDLAASLIREGTFLFTVRADDEDGSDQLLYRFDFDGDGNWDVRDAVANSAVHTYGGAGTYTVRVGVTDTWSGASAEAEREIAVQEWVPDNLPPEINAIRVTTEPRGVAHLAVDARDPEGGRVDLVVHWGDEPDEETLAALAGFGGTHRYAFRRDGAPYRGFVQATDGIGASVRREFEVRIEDRPTVVSEMAAHLIREGTVLYAVAADDGDGADGLTYSFDFDDDGRLDLVDQRTSSVVHTYDAPGLYRARVVVTDTWSGNTAEGRTQIEILPWVGENAPPIVQGIEVTTGPRGAASIQVIANDPEGGRLDLVVHWGDEAAEDALSPMAGFRADHRYALPEDGEPYQGYVLVTDANGNSVRGDFAVPVADRATAILGINQNRVREGTYLFTVNAEDGDGPEVLRYSFDYESDGVWDVVDQVANTSVKAYGDNARHTATVRVTDSWSGATGEGEVTVGGDDVIDENRAPMIHGVEVSVGPGGRTGLVIDATDPEGGRLTSTVHWGDEAEENAIEALVAMDGQHVYPYPADGLAYEGWVVVADALGAEARAAFTAEIADVKTVIRNVSVAHLGNGRVQVTASAVDADTRDLMYAFDMNGDGAYEVEAQPENSAFYTYLDAGDYDIVVAVTDPWSGVVTEGRADFTLEPWEQEVPIGGDHLEGEEGRCLVFRIGGGQLSTKVDPEVCRRAANPDPGAWHWEFGDGSSADGSEVGHIYRDDGVYDMVVTGGTESRPLRSTIQVYVANAAPEFLTQPPVLVEAGRTYTYDVEILDPGADEVRVSLDEGPEGMTLQQAGDDRHWTLTWEVPQDAAGTTVRVALRAIDGHTVEGNWVPDEGAGAQRYAVSVSGELDDGEEPINPDAGIPLADAGEPDAGPNLSTEAFSGSSCNCDVASGTPAGALFLLGLLGLVRPRRRR